MDKILTISAYIAMVVFLTTCGKINLKKKCCDDSKYEENITDKNLRISAPNIITPNNDSRNDGFYYQAIYINDPDPNGYSIPSFTVKKLKVYKLTGNKPVFESNDYKNDFIGNDKNGKQLEEGKYRYELTLDNNSVKGNLCIIRSRNICTDNCKFTDPDDQFLLNMSCN
jgi:hypothetical protein